jgi:hypothetical protein
VIRHDLEEDFKEVIGNRIEKIAPVTYAFQELSDVPEGFSVPADRKKPWGTGQAILSIRGLVEEPFLVINADDYYGKEVFRKIHTYMVEQMDVNAPVYDICMGGFILANTLSENGGVTRGVCEVGEGEILKRVTETYNIQKTADGMTATDKEGNPVSVQENQHVSMNMWGLTPGFVEELEKGFPEFLAGLKEGDVKSEYLLPTIIDQMIHDGRARVKLLETHDCWFGVTTGNTVTDTSHLHPGEPVGKPHLTPSVHRGPVSDPSLSYIQPHPSPIHSSPDTKPRHLSSLHFQDCRPIPDPHTPSKPAGTTSPPPKEMLPPSRSPSVPALSCKIPPLISSYSTKYFQ